MFAKVGRKQFLLKDLLHAKIRIHWCNADVWVRGPVEKKRNMIITQ